MYRYAAGSGCTASKLARAPNATAATSTPEISSVWIFGIMSSSTVMIVAHVSKLPEELCSAPIRVCRRCSRVSSLVIRSYWGAHTKRKFKDDKELSPRGVECECTQKERSTSITKQLVVQYPFCRKTSCNRVLERFLLVECSLDGLSVGFFQFRGGFTVR